MKRNNYVKKLFACSLFLALFVSGVSAQNAGVADTNQSGSLDELVILPIRLPALQEVGGSPFMTPDYKLASVQVGEKTVSAVPVKFNIFNNAIMVQKGGADMKLEFFEQVAYDVTSNDGSVKHFIFKAGYPEIDKNSDKTIYQVLSMGPKVHLLKFISQKVEDINTLGDYSRREIVTSEEFYLYVPGSKIKKIKPGKKDLVAALPELSGKIEEIASANNLKLKTESEITLLVEQLNKP